MKGVPVRYSVNEFFETFTPLRVASLGLMAGSPAGSQWPAPTPGKYPLLPEYRIKVQQLRGIETYQRPTLPLLCIRNQVLS